MIFLILRYVKPKPKKERIIIEDVTMFDFVKTQLRLKGEHYDFEGKDYLKNIMNDLPSEMVIMSGRQVEKSTTLSNKIVSHAINIPKIRIAYIGPVFKQVATFSKDRLMPLLNTSTPYVRSYGDRKSGAKLSVTDITLTNMSYIALRSLYNDSVDSTRGLSNDVVCYDEVQDIVKDNIPVVNETTSHSFLLDEDTGMRGRIMYTGTPKSKDNTIEQLWQASTQDMLGFKCPRCGKWIIGGGIENIREEGFSCAHCSRVIDLREVSKEWIRSFGKDDGVKMVGYHLSQLMMPWITWKSVWSKFSGKDKYEDYRFFNEVLGYSFDNSEKMFSETEWKSNIIAAREGVKDWESLWKYANTYSVPMYYLGLDWGHGTKSKTVFTVSAFMEGKLTPIFVKKFGPSDGGRDAELKYVQKFMRERHNSVLGVDYGDGYLEDQKLVEEFGLRRVFVIMHNDALGSLIRFKPKENYYITNRTDIMSKYFGEVKGGEIAFIGVWDGMWDVVAVDYIAVSRERRSTGRHFYTHIDPDDAVHSNLYSAIAFWIKNGTIKPSLSEGDGYLESELVYANEYNYEVYD